MKDKDKEFDLDAYNRDLYNKLPDNIQKMIDEKIIEGHEYVNPALIHNRLGRPFFEKPEETIECLPHMVDGNIVSVSVGDCAALIENLRSEEVALTEQAAVRIINNAAPYAKWEYVEVIEKRERYNGGYYEVNNSYHKCSCCGKKPVYNYDECSPEEEFLTKYCPHCGAKMENGKDYE